MHRRGGEDGRVDAWWHQREAGPYQLLDHAKSPYQDHAKSRYQVLDHGKSSVDACTKSLEYAK